MKAMGQNRATVIGGGLVGSLLAILLKKKGFEVELFEKLADPRSELRSQGRSINLVVTRRGLSALRLLGLDSKVKELTVPVYGRMMHSLEGELTYQAYGKDQSECNYSVSRIGLNRFLIDQAEKEGVKLHFKNGLISASQDEVEFESGEKRPAERVFGADGAFSQLRTSLKEQGLVTERVDFLDQGYKELLIPAASGGKYSMEKNALHIWPRGEFMFMALPNLDGSFTGTLYLPNKGQNSFESLKTKEQVRAFFEREFSDVVPLLPGLEEEYLSRPSGSLCTVRSKPWNVGRGNQFLLIGDAAHAIVPFFGQGMNTGFEDCECLESLMESESSLDGVFQNLYEKRKPSADAIADMALENFVEMREKVGDQEFLKRKKVEGLLEKEMPERYRSRYSLVMYSQIPFELAKQAGEINGEILNELCSGLDRAESLDFKKAEALIDRKLKPFIERHQISLDY